MNNLITVSQARASLPKLVKKASDELGRYVITVNNRPKAALLSIEELESLEETSEILSILGAKKSIEKGMKEAKKGEGKPLRDLMV